jgi:hypothetical protein
MLQLADRDDDPVLRQEVGIRLLQAGRDAEGVRVLTTLLETDPKNQAARQALDEYRLRRGPGNDKRNPSLDPPL